MQTPSEVLFQPLTDNIHLRKRSNSEGRGCGVYDCDAFNDLHVYFPFVSVPLKINLLPSHFLLDSLEILLLFAQLHNNGTNSGLLPNEHAVAQMSSST